MAQGSCVSDGGVVSAAAHDGGCCMKEEALDIEAQLRSSDAPASSSQAAASSDVGAVAGATASGGGSTSRDDGRLGDGSVDVEVGEQATSQRPRGSKQGKDGAGPIAANRRRKDGHLSPTDAWVSRKSGLCVCMTLSVVVLVVVLWCRPRYPSWSIHSLESDPYMVNKITAVCQEPAVGAATNSSANVSSQSLEFGMLAKAQVRNRNFFDLNVEPSHFDLSFASPHGDVLLGEIVTNATRIVGKKLSMMHALATFRLSKEALRLEHCVLPTKPLSAKIKGGARTRMLGFLSLVLLVECHVDILLDCMAWASNEAISVSRCDWHFDF